MLHFYDVSVIDNSIVKATGNGDTIMSSERGHYHSFGTNFTYFGYGLSGSYSNCYGICVSK